MARCAGVGIVTLLLLVAVAPAAAQTTDWLNKNTLNHGSTIKELLQVVERVGRDDAAVGDELARLRRSFGIVFVPGILGSTLESKSKGKLWGFGLPNADQLRLDSELIDETKESDVTTQLAESLGPVSLYAAAIARIRDSAAKVGIPQERVVACGYDWRRDIRWGARELDACIRNAPALRDATALVVIAHSMGGVVTWQWHQAFAPDGTVTGKRLVALAVLGSPLAGSCEMLRMVETGYVQPVVNDKLQNDEWIKGFWSKIAGMKDRLVNEITAAFSQDLRPVILTWPGAIELTPRPGATIDDVSCVRVPVDPTDATNRGALTYYTPEFWSAPTGSDLLSHVPAPATTGAVLEKAKKFREAFTATTVATPTYLFASHVWRTPNLAGLTGDFRRSNQPWMDEQGDGRVPFLSAFPPTITAANVTRVYSVHGNLPEDDVFHDDFFGDRLPRILDAYVAAGVLKLMIADPARQQAFIGKGGTLANPEDFHAAFERQNAREIIYKLTREAYDMAIAFNSALCDLPNLCLDYKKASAAAGAATTEAAKAAVYTGVLQAEPGGSREATFAQAQRGLAMARSYNWAAAIADLRTAVPALDEIAASYGAKEPNNIRRLRVNATAMLGRAYVIRGYCDEAREPLKAAAKAGHPRAVGDLNAPCYDRQTGKIVSLK
ncbi:MAG: hypothetical protein HY216_04005 [Candidatus Rokubacteria bacterium]|nr:hypothetical protein [Candidatus Rokubacteria bacterium]